MPQLIAAGRIKAGETVWQEAAKGKITKEIRSAMRDFARKHGLQIVETEFSILLTRPFVLVSLTEVDREMRRLTSSCGHKRSMDSQESRCVKRDRKRRRRQRLLKRRLASHDLTDRFFDIKGPWRPPHQIKPIH